MVSIMEKLFRELSFNDLRLLSALRGEKSLRAVARIVNIEPAAISKRVARLEELFGTEIVKRSPRGIIFTSDGERLVEKAMEVLKNAEDVLGASVPQSEFDSVLSIGSRGFLNIMLAEPFMRAIQGFSEKVRLRFIDMSPQELQRAAMTGAIDIAIHFEKFDWTSSWTSAESSELRWSLFARKNHPLPNAAKLSDVLKYPFVVPGHWTGDKLVTGEDGFSVPWRNRIKGHEVQTAANALRIVRSTNQLVFLPTVLAHEFLIDGEVKPIEVFDLAEVKKAVYVSAQTDRVSQKQFRLLVNAVNDLVRSEVVNVAIKKFGAGDALEVTI